MVSRFVALIALLVSSSQVLAADPDGNYSVRGVGLVDCAAFTQERARKSPAYQMIGGFIDGYLTEQTQVSRALTTSCPTSRPNCWQK